ncbi:hypothetical protein ACFSBZ_01585 [Amnibacterium flavum]|uniref:hypothetical protein n=1 Tax=Amnibacterium flavum TaxID=2173173 RepID=UPI001F0B8B36|nr:hypothetical protein [Amnibacterium flavum]
MVATASKKNHDLMRRLGASRVFEYTSATAVADIASAVAGESVAGIFAVGTGSAEKAVAIAAATGTKRVMMASPPVSFESIPRRPGLSVKFLRVMARLVASNAVLQARCARHGIRARFVWGSTLMNNEVGPMLWERFLPGALAEGRYLALPEPQVVGSGLEQLQPALDLLRAGVSARKLVVTL